MGRAKIRFKHDEKFGEAILLDKQAFIITDVDAEEKEIQKTSIKDDGSLAEVQKSSFEELEKAIASVKMPSKVFIKERTFESLKKLFGRDVEILVNY